MDREEVLRQVRERMEAEKREKERILMEKKLLWEAEKEKAREKAEKDKTCFFRKNCGFD